MHFSKPFMQLLPKSRFWWTGFNESYEYVNQSPLVQPTGSLVDYLILASDQLQLWSAYIYPLQTHLFALKPADQLEKNSWGCFHTTEKHLTS